jgi:hypothetical protein
MSPKDVSPIEATTAEEQPSANAVAEAKKIDADSLSPTTTTTAV